MSIIIGLTGPTGSGKSSACKLCQEFGLLHVDCDKLTRKAQEKGSDGLKALCLAFGDGILNPDGTLNRKTLARIAFSSKEETKKLEATIFPYIKELVLKETEKGNTLLDAPTLFESGLNDICFKTVAVLCDKQTRTERIIARDNLSKEDALLRINAGKPDDFYKQNADFVVYNNGTEADFLKSFKEILLKILKSGE